MAPFELVAALMAFVGIAGWINAKTLHLPHGVAMLIAGLIAAGGPTGFKEMPKGTTVCS